MQPIIPSKFLWLLISLVAIACPNPKLWAQKFYATPESIEVGERDVFEVSYVLDGASLNDFQAPSFSDFNVVGGPSKSTSMQIINGSMSSSASVSYSLQPKRVGKFTIPAATVTTNQKQTLRSGKISVTVSKGSRSPAASPNSRPNNPFGGGGFPFPFPGAPQPPGTVPQTATPSNEDVFVRIVTDTTQVYQGEQVTVSFRIYSNSDVSDFNLLTPPAFTGFWVEDISNSSSTMSHQEKVNGKIYTAFDVKRYALFPQQAGQFVLHPIEAEVVVQIPDPTWGGFFSRQKPLVLRSDSALLRVNELPEAGKPSDFSGAVGTFTLHADANTANLKTGDVFTLNVTIAGEGNIKLLQAPDPEFPPILEKYDPQITEDVFTKMYKINGRRSFEYSLMPLKTGEATIPPIAFSYYDTKLRRYETLHTAPIPLRIAQGSKPVPTPQSDTDISEPSHNKPSFAWYLVTLTALGIIGATLYYWKQKSNAPKTSDTYDTALATYTRSKRSDDHPLIIALKKAETSLKQGNTRSFYDQTHQVIGNYLTRKYNIKQADLTAHSLPQQLLEQGVPEPDARLAADIIQQCEIALFAPIAHNINNAHFMYEQTLGLIRNMENL
jgi:hypothetical protein